MAEFDSYSESYRDLVTRSVRVSGEPSEYFAAYKARYISRLCQPVKIERVLDYGCGVGSLAEQIKVHLPRAKVDGYDPSQESVNCISQALLGQGSFRCELDLLQGGYDMIVISNVLHHVRPESRLAVFSQILQMLTPGGRVVIFEHNPINPLTRWAVSQCVFDGDAILLHSSEVKNFLRRAGFIALQRDFIVFFPRWFAGLRPLEPHLNWLPFGAQYAFSGERPSAS